MEPEEAYKGTPPADRRVAGSDEGTDGEDLAEELQAVNDELKTKVEEATRARSDLENLIVSTEIATLFLDRELRIKRFTPRVREHFHILSSDVGCPLAGLAHKFHHGGLLEDAEAVLESPEVKEREIESEEGRWYLVHLRPYRTVDDRIDGVVITFVDITERRRVEEELWQSKFYSEMVVDSVPEPLLVLTPDLRVKTANETFYKAFGTQPADTEGRKIYDLGNGQWDIPALRELLEDVLPDNDVFSDCEVTHNFEHIGRRTMLLSGRRLDDVQLILLAIKDITARKQAEVTLRESERQYRLFIESAKEYAIFMTDIQGRITTWNAGAERTFGYTEEEALGRPAADIFTEEDRAAGVPAQEMTTALTTGQALDERWHVRKDGSRFWGTGVMEVLQDEDGHPQGFVKVMRDNTRRKRNEEALRELNETLEQQVEARTEQVRALMKALTMAEQEERHRIARVLHDDLQQQLYGLDMTLAMLRQAPSETEAQRLHGQADEVLDQAIHLTRSLATELSPPVLQSSSLEDILRWLALQEKEQHGLDVEIEKIGAVQVPVLSLRVLLYQALREVLFNVVKHAGVRHARVTAREEAGEVVVRVEDEGAGFDVAALKTQVFPEGGFGLPTVRQRLELVGGRLHVDSAPGRGTRVTLAVPLPSGTDAPS